MYRIILGLLISQVLLAVFGVQTPQESLVGGAWQLSGVLAGVLACWLTKRAADEKRARAKSDGESTSAVFRR